MVGRSETIVRRRDFVRLAGVAATWPLAAHAQQLNNLPRLCFLTFDPGTLQSPSPRFEAFFQGLRDLGYIDGQTIAIDYLSADSHGDRFPALAAECVRLSANVIAVTTTPAAKVAKNTTRTIPIVMISLGDPVGAGLVDSLEQPGGNVTGMSQMVTELAAKRLELLKQGVPSISRVLVLSYLADPIASLQVNALKEAAPSLGVMLQIQDIRTPDDLPAAFDAGIRQHADALLTTAESMFFVNGERVSELAAHYRLPAMYPFSAPVLDAGGLMAYEVDNGDLQTRAAAYVDKILKGAKPSDLPVQQPTEFKLFINLKAAKAIGLTIPESFLQRADQLIE